METKAKETRADKKLYKVLKEGVSYNGGNYEYDLPKQNEDGSWKPGKWTKRIAKAKVSMCNNGYHLTTDPQAWFQTGAKVFLAEAKDIMGWAGDKCVCAQVRLLEQIDTNTGKDNTGEFNSGNSNSGDSNSGNRNSGYSNSGYSNSGDSNSGYRNSGYRNSGDSNSGNWNAGALHTGAFNTGKPKKIYLFNKLMSYKQYQKISFPDYFYFDLTEWVWYTEEEMKDDKHKQATSGYLKTYEYKEAWKNSFEKASKQEVEQTVKLPNFSYKLFVEITGITRKMMSKKLKESD